jgi:hypothetical protein
VRCQPIAKANASPKYRRFDNSQRVMWLGQRVASDDAVKATKKKGSAQRTENRIMNSVPRADRKLVKGKATQIAALMANASSLNKRQDSGSFPML